MAQVERLGRARVRALAINGTKVTATAADLNLAAGMAAAGSRVKKVAKVALAGAAIHGGVQAWQNPEGAAIVINRVTVDATTKSTAAGTLSVGATATSATTASANLIDTLDVGTAAGTFDNLQNPGTNGKQLQRLAGGKWVTFGEASGNVTGLVGSLFVEYFLV
jgi:hypothetical protein